MIYSFLCHWRRYYAKLRVALAPRRQRVQYNGHRLERVGQKKPIPGIMIIMTPARVFLYYHFLHNHFETNRSIRRHLVSVKTGKSCHHIDIINQFQYSYVTSPYLRSPRSQMETTDGKKKTTILTSNLIYERDLQLVTLLISSRLPAAGYYKLYYRPNRC